MNREQRRKAAKAGRHVRPERQETPATQAEPARPGLILRLFASIVLAPAVLKRVNHADVERLLANVALQAGRPEVARELLGRRNPVK
jgi:hypothetical protein